MNHLLHPISWHQYLTTALIIAILYYLILTLRCYRPELQKLQRRLSGDKPNNPLQALQYQPEEQQASVSPLPSLTEQPHREESINDNDILAGQVKACIAKAADKPFAPAVLIPQLKQILQQHQELAATERPAINHLVVGECERTGTALLTEEEVDQWWER